LVLGWVLALAPEKERGLASLKALVKAQEWGVLWAKSLESERAVALAEEKDQEKEEKMDALTD